MHFAAHSWQSEVHDKWTVAEQTLSKFHIGELNSNMLYNLILV
jgi:hypothetical protein